MREQEYTVEELANFSLTNENLIASLYYWDKNEKKILDVVKFTDDLAYVVLSDDKEEYLVEIFLCEFHYKEPVFSSDSLPEPSPSI